MPEVVDLTAKPHALDDAQVGWVEFTLTDEEKVGQLFVNLFHFGADASSGNELTNAEIPAATQRTAPGCATRSRHCCMLAVR